MSLGEPSCRGRGRPKGSKNIPCPAAFVASSLIDPPALPVPSAPPAKRKLTGPWAGMSPEERSAYAKKLAAARRHHGGGKPPGVPRTMTVAAYREAMEAQRPIVAAVIKKMEARGQLPDDPRAVEALEVAMVVLRSPVGPRERNAAARIILDFSQAKPTGRVVEIVKTADEWLDEMAEE